MAETGYLAAKMDVDEAAIDEGLYSRQLWVSTIDRAGGYWRV